MRIGLFTGGGDCGGLEAVIRGVVFAAHSENIEVLGIPNGYLGLYNLDKNPGIILQCPMVDNRAKKCGTIIGTSRVKLNLIPDGFEKVKKNLENSNIDILIGAGGDDTSLVLEQLSNAGFKVIWVPKTMDLDILPYSVGGSSAINKIADAVYELRTTARSHDRILVVEVFGRYVGHTALYGGVAGQADMILIPEIPVDVDYMYRTIIEKYRTRLENSPLKKSWYMIVVSEGIKDIRTAELITASSELDHFGHVQLGGAGEYIVNIIKKKLKEDDELKTVLDKNGVFIKGVLEYPNVRSVNLGHTIRSGISDAYDATQGQKYGAAAIECVKRGYYSIGIADVKGDKIYTMPIGLLRQQRPVNMETVALYEKMGYNCGRKPVEYRPEIKTISSSEITRIF